MNWNAVLLSIKVTSVATLALSFSGIALALVLARVPFRGKTVVETAISLPLVLPPTVVGYYLLLGLGKGSPVVEWFHVQILFTWPAAAIASVTTIARSTPTRDR